MKRITIVLLVALGLGATSQPTGHVPPEYACAPTTANITVDGSLAEPAWENAPWTSDFVDIVGTNDRPAPSLRTRAKLLWDADHLYVAAELTDPQVAATIRQRDAQLFREQAFELFIDPGADGKDYLEVQVNPLNTVCDLAMDKPYLDGGKANVGFNLAGLRTAVRVNGTVNESSDADKGWVAELAIPWAAIKGLSGDTVAPPDGAQPWRMNFARMRTSDAGGERGAKVRRDMWVWSAQGAINMHLPDRWGSIRFTFADRSQKP